MHPSGAACISDLAGKPPFSASGERRPLRLSYRPLTRVLPASQCFLLFCFLSCSVLYSLVVFLLFSRSTGSYEGILLCVGRILRTQLLRNSRSRSCFFFSFWLLFASSFHVPARAAFELRLAWGCFKMWRLASVSSEGNLLVSTTGAYWHSFFTFFLGCGTTIFEIHEPTRMRDISWLAIACSCRGTRGQ